MSEIKLNDLINKVRQLSVEDRLRLFNQVVQAELMDESSRLSDPSFDVSRLDSPKIKKFEETRSEGKFSVSYSENSVAIRLDNRYIFRVFFYPDNLVESRLQLADKAGDEIALLEGEARKISGEISALLPKLSWMLCNTALEIGTMAFRDLHGLTEADFWDWSREEIANLRPEEIYNFRVRSKPKDIEHLFKPFVAQMKTYFEIVQGGARETKKPFVWTPERALEFYEAVNSLPSIADKPMWEYASERLRDNDFDLETFTWLRSRPAFADVPEDLLREAADEWKLHEESWNSLPPKNSPQAYAFRHVCSKLGIPNYAYNTLRAKYYDGKRMSFD